MRWPGCTGDKNNDWVMSPMPLVLLFISGSGWLINGMMVREITFQSAFKRIGTTGWMLSISCVRLNGPELKLVLPWNGTLTRSAIGFCDAFCKSSSFAAPRSEEHTSELQ